MKFFNTAGPNKADKHYALEPLTRINLDEMMLLIQQEKYFVLHAPRQTGKTTLLYSLMHRINSEGKYQCVYVNVEAAQAVREDVEVAIRAILCELAGNLHRYLGDQYLEDHVESLAAYKVGPSALRAVLSSWAEACPKPIVLLIDEIDALVGDTLISVLRQIRAGYTDRPKSFPQSIVLCGVRDVRDYRIHASSEKDPISGGSAFNIKAESLRMGNFNEAETHALLQQHSDETGQIFTTEAKQAIWENSQGQPWLVNALAYEVTMKMEANRDRTVTLTASMVLEARENLILRRETHLDQLADKLREPRVHRVIAPILACKDQSTRLRDDDVAYVRDLGLIETKPQIRVANPIYREVIPRMLVYPIQVSLSQQSEWYISSETGLLDMSKLLQAFQQFFRENSKHWTQLFQYKEAGAQLLLQAFLQRVINGGGRIEREYALGRGRTDLFVTIPHAGGIQKIVLELKIQRGKRQTTLAKALPQITRYMDECGTSEAHLILFDSRQRKWKAKIYQDETRYQGVPVRIWGM